MTDTVKRSVDVDISDHITEDRVKTPRGSFRLVSLSVDQMESAGYGLHHSSGDYDIMTDGTQAFAIRHNMD